MAQQAFTKESFWLTFDTLGEDQVRLNVRTKLYSSANQKLEWAEEWLFRKELACNAASTAEQARVARSDNRAAWTAATTAIIAAIITIIGTTITIILNWPAISRALSFD